MCAECGELPMIAWLLKALASRAFAWIVAGGIFAGGIAYIETLKSRAYERGVAARDAEAREVIGRLEARLAERMKKNESKTDDEIDCELRRLRNPKAECK
jgi:hypothetical protein